YDIYTADECFLTGTAAEIIPAVRLDSREIGDGKPGPVTQRLTARFRQLTETTGTAIY
ncbi:MAG: branched-chain amino acid aminotransferase, partial [Verrucomicrobiota bacterium]